MQNIASELADVRRKQLNPQTKEDQQRMADLRRQQAELEERLNRLYKPVVRVFVEELRPSLYGLLMDRQKSEILSSSRKAEFLALEAAVRKETLRAHDEASKAPDVKPEP